MKQWNLPSTVIIQTSQTKTNHWNFKSRFQSGKGADIAQQTTNDYFTHYITRITVHGLPFKLQALQKLYALQYICVLHKRAGSKPKIYGCKISSTGTTPKF